MTTRKAYAKSADGHEALMFPNKEVRDLFLENVDGYQTATYAEYKKVERADKDYYWDKGRYEYKGHSDYHAYDMALGESWDYDNWMQVWDKAVALGII